VGNFVDPGIVGGIVALRIEVVEPGIVKRDLGKRQSLMLHRIAENQPPVAVEALQSFAVEQGLPPLSRCRNGVAIQMNVRALVRWCVGALVRWCVRALEG
jgi:hypothetical protein